MCVHLSVEGEYDCRTGYWVSNVGGETPATGSTMEADNGAVVPRMTLLFVTHDLNLARSFEQVERLRGGVLEED